LLFLDGSLIKYPSKIVPMIEAAWEDGTGTYTVPYLNHPFHFADNEAIIEKAIYRCRIWQRLVERVTGRHRLKIIIALA
jgi:hypothetical protein